MDAMKASLRGPLVLDARLQGMKLREIAASMLALPEEQRTRFGIGPKYDARLVWKDIQRELGLAREAAAPLAEELLEVQRQRLDSIYRTLAKKLDDNPAGIAPSLLMTWDRITKLEGLAKEPGTKDNPFSVVFQASDQGLL